MNNFQPNKRHQSIGNTVTVQNAEETLIADSRSFLTPSQIVEQKLIGMRKNSLLLVSQVQRRLKPGPR